MALIPLLVSSCARVAGPTTPESEKIVTSTNPHPSGSYEAFIWKNYPNTSRLWKNHSLLAISTPSDTHVTINIGAQRGFLMVGNEIAMDYRISTGRQDKYDTPLGEYQVTERVEDKRSNIYGKIFDANGDVVNLDADIRKDEIPLEGEFLGAPMLFWMRLTNDGIGMHQGDVISHFASHGCIRSHHAAIPIVFAKTKIGTPVFIEP